MTSGKIISLGTFYSLIFAVPVAFVCYFISSLFKTSVRGTVNIVLMGIISLLFMSQFIYFKIFRMFYSWYSATKVGHILEFWEIIVMKIKNNFLALLLLSLPFICLCIFKNELKIASLLPINEKSTVILMMIACHMLGILSLPLAGKEIYTPYDLYFHHDYPVVAAEKLGLITTLRLDAKREIMNWSPTLVETNQSITLIRDDQLPHYETQPPKPISEENRTYNVLDIDFDKLITEAESEDMIKMHRYFKNAKPSAKNKYTGKYKGYNLICITAEGFSPYAIREDLTPTLYKIAHEGYQFTNFYTPLWEVSTSDGEYAICSGQIPQSGVWSMSASSDKAMPFTLGNQLKKQGYHTMAFHNHNYDYYDRNLSHTNMGYHYEAKGLGLEVTNTWPESDVEMMDQTVSRYIDHEPFHTYYMTVSGHMNYSFRENAISKKNAELVAHLELSDTAKAYLACQIELDRAIESLMMQLEAEGVLDHTLIMITPDHYPYGLNNEYISELAGHTIEENFELYRSSLLLYTPNMKPTKIDKPCSSLDVLPTLSNLMGIDFDSRLFVGRDIFSDSLPLVLFYSHNFITDKGRYNALTNEFIARKDAEVDEAYVRDCINEVDAKFYYSAKILETDYYKLIETALNEYPTI